MKEEKKVDTREVTKNTGELHRYKDDDIQEKHFEAVIEEFTPIPQGIYRVTEHAKHKIDVENKWKKKLDTKIDKGIITHYALEIQLMYDPNVKQPNKLRP